MRVSGKASKLVAEKLLGHCPKPRRAEYLPFRNTKGELLDEGIALYFPGPNSFTGEDVLELQGHGGPVLIDMIIKAILNYPVYALLVPASSANERFSTTSST